MNTFVFFVCDTVNDNDVVVVDRQKQHSRHAKRTKAHTQTNTPNERKVIALWINFWYVWLCAYVHVPYVYMSMSDVWNQNILCTLVWTGWSRILLDQAQTIQYLVTGACNFDSNVKDWPKSTDIRNFHNRNQRFGDVIRFLSMSCQQFVCIICKWHAM